MKLAFYSLTSCEGCLTTLLTKLGPDLEILWDLFDIDYFKLVREPIGGSKVPSSDIAFVEGAVVTDLDKDRLEEIRRNSSYLVALGTCASTGNIAYTASRMIHPQKDVLKGIEVHEAEPISSVVSTDFELIGCPVSSAEFTTALLRLANRLEPVQPDYKVCYECRIAGNPCLLESGRIICLGPITRGGCGAACPSVGAPCYGCRGPAEEGDLDAYLKTLEMRGLDKKRALDLLRMFIGKKTKEVFGDEH